MTSRARLWTRPSSCNTRLTRTRSEPRPPGLRPPRRARGWAEGVLLVAVLACTRVAAAASGNPTTLFVRALDAYFAEQPYRSIVLMRDSMARPDTAPLREASLYVVAQSFAAIHLYEKAEDSLSGLLSEFPGGRFAPVAVRELARIFFDLHEYGAVVNLEQSLHGKMSDSVYPVEFWYLLGQSSYLIGKKEQARAPLRRVPPGTSFYPFARFTLAQVEFALDRPDAALGHLNEVVADSAAPTLLRERALRVAGMILYQQRRFADAVETYRSIPDSSPLFGQSRVDLALAAEAGGNSEAARLAFADAMERASDDLIRTEARVAVGRFLTRQQKAAAARTLFDQALGDLKAREQKLRAGVEVDGEFRRTFAELVTFSRQSGGNPRQQRLAEDLELLRATLASTMGATYEHAPILGFEKISPKTYLFPLLRQHFHDPAIIETFVELAVELEDLKKQLATLESDVRAQAGVWNAQPPLQLVAVPDTAKDAIQQMIWLLFAQYDLTTRFYDALAVNEKIAQGAAAEAKQRALAQTLEAIRLVLFGNRQIPSQQSLLAVMERARGLIADGKLPGMLAQKVRDGFLQEWQSDKDSLSYVVENLDLKQRQMLSALVGVPLRSRNVNLPVLSTMTEWLSALEQLVGKYQYIELEPGMRPWHLAGKANDAAALLTTASRSLDELSERGVQVLRDTARDLVAKEAFRHSLIVAQAEEGIADALFEERSGR